MTFDKEIQKVNHEMARISEKVNIHNTVVPNLEEYISDESD